MHGVREYTMHVFYGKIIAYYEIIIDIILLCYIFFYLYRVFTF